VQSPPGARERYRDSPFVCGYLGRDRASLWTSLVEAAPVGVRERTRGPAHAFAASRAPGLERVPGQTAWTWGRYVHSRRRPRRWRDAAHNLALAGLWVEGNPRSPRVTLHTDGLGLHSVFVREIEGTTYFASRSEPLARLGNGSLHIDWDAWGSHLLLGGFAFGATGFREIRRLGFAESLLLSRSSVSSRRDIPDWMMAERADGSVEDVLDALLEEMSGRDLDEPSALGLSGGWDSRMIAVLLDHLGARPPSVWATHKDMGRVDDIELGQQVAKALGWELSVVPQLGAGYWRRHREPTLWRFEHEVVLHTWLSALSARVRRQGVPVYDGLAGDVLARSSGVREDVLTAGESRDRREAAWAHLGGHRQMHANALRPALLRRWYEDARTSYLADGALFEGLPNELSLRLLTMKSNRIIGLSPMRLLAPEVPVRLPFLAPRVAGSLLRVPSEAKVDKQFYRALIGALNPVVAALPSTNDGQESVKSTVDPGQFRPKVMAALAERIVQDPLVLSAFRPPARELLRDGQGGHGTPISVQAMQWAEVVTSWRERFRDVLAEDPPEA
jgi:hypothetical protein